MLQCIVLTYIIGSKFLLFAVEAPSTTYLGSTWREGMESDLIETLSSHLAGKFFLYNHWLVATSIFHFLPSIILLSAKSSVIPFIVSTNLI